MKIYTLQRTQTLPITLAEAWAFFSSPHNLVRITPAHMHFRMLYASGNGALYPGQIIRYRVNIFPGVPVQWVTEITHAQEPHYFIDEQRYGPYAWWHHQHRFEEVPGGVEMTDEVNYAIPLGLLGRLAHALFVERALNTIFDHRFATLGNYFTMHPSSKY